jgi:nitrogen fixation protein NifU and related proteins
MKLYQEHIHHHFRYPHHRGHLESPDAVGNQQNPSCGDRVSIELVCTDQNISEIAFDGVGCIISQATASMVTEHLLGRSIQDALALTKDDIKQMLGLELGPVRLKCALLSLDALHDAIIQYQKKQ